MQCFTITSPSSPLRQYPNVKGLSLIERGWGEEKKRAILDFHMDVFAKVGTLEQSKRTLGEPWDQ